MSVRTTALIFTISGLQSTDKTMRGLAAIASMPVSLNLTTMNDPANEYIESAVIAFLVIVGVVLFFVIVAKIITYRKRD